MDEAPETPAPGAPTIDPQTLRELTAEILAAYVAHNSVPAAHLAGLIGDVHAALAKLGQSADEKPELLPLVPAVPVKKSVFDDRLISLIDGRSYKSLKRHLGVNGYTPASYRAAYGLPGDYPMVCRDYAARRSTLAKGMGLGTQANKAKPAAAAA